MRTAQPISAGIDVLIADDEAMVRGTVRFLLEREGYRCAEAADGQEALDLVRSRFPRCVLLDLAMPGLDGFTIARRLRSEHTRPLHIHCLTGSTDPGSRRLASEAGCETFLTKPVDAATLLTVVGRDVKPLEAEWVSGLTLVDAEGLLDWREANGYPPSELTLREDGFAVRRTASRPENATGQ